MTIQNTCYCEYTEAIGNKIMLSNIQLALVDFGEDVSRVVLHILNEGGSIKEINKTFITLDPKVKSACKVKEFKPIA